jgi:delta1-piperideine-2-carboxylate reductase
LISYEALSARLALILYQSGCSKRVADLLARNCAAAERDGAYSHGLFRIPGYVSSLKGNWVDGTAVPRLEDVAPGFLRIDAVNGYAIPALELGRQLAIEKVRRNGIAIVAIRNSHHLGALSLDVEPFAASGLVALTVLNSMKSVVPHGGRAAVFGTNPLAFAAPRAGGPALVIDQATSVMAYGDVQQAALAGLQVGDGVGIDSQGQKTTDPKAIIEGGALCTFGGHKGASIALMIEILCAALVGGHFSYEVNLSETVGAATPRTGQTLILIDPSTGRNQLPDFAGRVADLLRAVVAAGQERLPGERRFAARERSLREGITLTDAMSATLSGIEQALRPQRTM